MKTDDRTDYLESFIQLPRSLRPAEPFPQDPAPIISCCSHTG
jgi:hypothetical protein